VVDPADTLVAVIDVPDTVSRGAQRDGLPDERAADQVLLASETDASFLLDLPHLVAAFVVDWR